jgi:hypothetical protein
MPSETRRGHPVVVSILVVAISFASTTLALAAFGECDVGVNQGANVLAVVMFGLPALLVVNALAVLGTGLLVRQAMQGPSGSRGALLAQVAVLFASAYLCWRYVATPGDYPSPWCQDNVPPWTPSWLPS